MKVILTTTIKKLGKIGDTVTVKPGFARNFLFPNNMALRENKKNIEHFEKIREEMKKNDDIKLDEAKNLIEQIKKIKIIFNKEADEKDQLYGSISKKEILDQFKENEIFIHSDDIEMKNPIRTLGEHEISVSPYLNITHTLKIKVNKN